MFVERVQEDHRIQAAGDSHHDRLPAFEQLAILDVLFNALEQIGHVPMLLHWRDGAGTAKVSATSGCGKTATDSSRRNW